MCGIGGMFSKYAKPGPDAANPEHVIKQWADIYQLLYNRGSSSHGISSVNYSDMNTINRLREQCPITETRHTKDIYNLLKGANMCLVQTRFTTNGANTALNAQPLIAYLKDGEICVFDGAEKDFSIDAFKCNDPYVKVVHNGEIRIPEKDNLFASRGHEINIPENRSDSTLLAAELLSNLLYAGDVRKAMESVYKEVEGAYSVIAVANIEDVFRGAFAYREGTRPLAIGETPDFFGIASETSHLALAGVPGDNIHLATPGVLYEFVLNDGKLDAAATTINENGNPFCFFEDLIYLQDVSSICDSIFPPQFFDKKFLEYIKNPEDVGNYTPTKDAIELSSKTHTSKEIREYLGRWLYRLRNDDIPEEYKFITEIPKSGKSVTSGMVLESLSSRNKRLIPVEAITINPLYKANVCPRDFLSSQEDREKQHERKLIFYQMPKYIILGDDSFVTGLTTRKVIKETRNNGAEKVLAISGSPPITGTCRGGINMKDGDRIIETIYPRKSQRQLKHLVTEHLPEVEIAVAEYLDADKVIYMPPNAIEMLLGPEHSLECVGGAKCGATRPIKL